ncbi:cytochrome P450 [Aspergillus navahoensis]
MLQERKLAFNFGSRRLQTRHTRTQNPRIDFCDIYGAPSRTRKEFPKSDRFYDNGHPNIAFVLDPDEHARQHKSFASQFRASTVCTQELIVHAHVDLWTAGFPAVPLDVSKWFEWLTFDTIGELTFGESLNATRDNKNLPWVSILLNAAYSGSIFNLCKRRQVHRPARCHDPCPHRKRIEAGPARSDVGDSLAHAIRARGMSDTELANQAMVLLTAGAETSATALTATLWYLAQPAHAPYLEQLHIADATARLPYLKAVLEETMRLFPPSPVGPPRIRPPGGETVDGTFVPGGVYVSADVWTDHHEARTVGGRPDRFEPERWCNGREKPYTVPFSIGPRAVLAFDWKLAEGAAGGSGNWVEEAKLKQLRQKLPLMMHFRR